MLKVFLGCVVSVVVLLTSAYAPLIVSKSYAASANVLITHIQAGGVGAATQEFIILYNNSDEEVDISGWCLTNKTNVSFACFGPSNVGQETYLPARKRAVIASEAMFILQPTGTVSLTYAPTSQSSGSITGSSDTISLVDHVGAVVDRQSWSTSIAAGMQFERRASDSPPLYNDTDTSADWLITIPGVLPLDETEVDTTIVDMCPNIDEIQLFVPIGKIQDSSGNCIDRQIVPLLLTEILPNALGSDEGQEFIELFNPNDFAVDLKKYVLYVGPNFENMYNFPDGVVIQPNEYISFTNKLIPFSLLNSSSRAALAPSDYNQLISETPAYVDPPEGQSWALIDSEWRYTNQPTPGSVNLLSTDNALGSKEDSSLQPCAPNQYRSPETNRCRLLTSVTKVVTPCKDGQYRSEETNRCRNIAADANTMTPCSVNEARNPDTGRCRKIVTASTPAPCKEGQERNSDTNRCRTITKMPKADYGVLGAETKSSGNWYVWVTVGAILLLALAYTIWEWHEEVIRFFRKQYQRILLFARSHK